MEIFKVKQFLSVMYFSYQISSDIGIFNIKYSPFDNIDNIYISKDKENFDPIDFKYLLEDSKLSSNIEEAELSSITITFLIQIIESELRMEIRERTIESLL